MDQKDEWAGQPLPFHRETVLDTEFTDADLEAYLDEMLDPEDAADVEEALRKKDELLQRLSYINSRRDAGIHTLGEIWRRNQIGVPSADEMAKFIQGSLADEHAIYIDFRMKTLKCRYTIAMFRDLQEQQDQGEPSQSESRRRKYFDSSAGLLKKND